MKKAYVVVEKSYEYNDEVYYEPEGGGTHPLKVFLKSDKAQAELERLELAQWKNFSNNKWSGPGYYAYDFNELLVNPDSFEDDIEKLLGVKGEDKWDLPTPDKEASDEVWIEYMNLFDLAFHEIREIDLDSSGLLFDGQTENTRPK